MKTQTFEDYLKDIHAEDYHGTDDDMPDDFERWLENLDNNDLMEYAEKWGIKLLKNIKPI